MDRIQDVRFYDTPDKNYDLGDKHRQGEGNFYFNGFQRLGHVVHPPGVKTGCDANRGKQYAAAQTMQCGMLKRSYAGNQVKDIKKCC